MPELDVKVVARKEEAQGICSFELEALDQGPLPPYGAGAHIDVQLAPGLIRQYSLCGDPQDSNRWRIGVLRDPHSRGGSVSLHEKAHVGTVLSVGRPRNLFPLVLSPHSVLVAGGIGITPILSMARELQRQGRSFELHYAARSQARMAFRDEIGASPFASRSHFCFSDEPGAQALDMPAVLQRTPPDSHLYVCGPNGFMEHVLGAARAHGWTEDRLHREHFAVAAQPATGERSFDIRLARSGRALVVPANRSVLQVLLENGVDVPFSCEAGVCGNCVTRVLQGVPDHRDSFFTDAERRANDQFTPCCSRAKTSELVLDL